MQGGRQRGIARRSKCLSHYQIGYLPNRHSGCGAEPQALPSNGVLTPTVCDEISNSMNKVFHLRTNRHQTVLNWSSRSDFGSKPAARVEHGWTLAAAD